VSLIAAAVLAAAVRRNPFQFVEKPKPPVVVERRPLRAPDPPVEVIPPQPAAEAATAPPLPEFGYQLIGRFGRADDPIAAFVGKGQVLTVQNGDTIEDTFVVRRIGVDSVELGFVNKGAETLTIRLPQ
jgi:hypothetical protein